MAKRYIDREKVLDKLLSMARGETEYHQMILSKALHLVAIEPTVDAVEVVHGRWIKGEAVKHTDGGGHIYYCSVCGDWYHDFVPKHCPGCGAKMDGKSDENL